MKKDNKIWRITECNGTDNLDKLEDMLNNSLNLFHRLKDSTTKDRYLGLVASAEMLLDWIKELKEESK